MEDAEPVPPILVSLGATCDWSLLEYNFLKLFHKRYQFMSAFLAGDCGFSDGEDDEERGEEFSISLASSCSQLLHLNSFIGFVGLQGSRSVGIFL